MTRRRVQLLLILLVALGLRLYGIDFRSYHPDESIVLKLARQMIDNSTLEPQKMSYGTLAIYLQAGALWAVQAVRSLLDTPTRLMTGEALLIVRLLSVVASVGTVALTACLARASLGATEATRERPILADWLGPLFLAVAFLSVQCAHYNTVDSLLALLTTGSVLMAFRAFEGAPMRVFVASGILAGLAAATKYTGVLAALPLAAVPLLSTRRPRPFKETFAGLVCVVGGFLLGMPYALIRSDKLFKALEYESNHYLTGGDTRFAMGPDTFRWNLEFLYYTGTGPGIALMAALFGLMWLLSRRWPSQVFLPELRRMVLLLLYPVVAFLFLARYTVRFDRNLLPVLPFVVTFAALYVEFAWHALSTRRWARALLAAAVILAVVYPLLRDVVFDWQLHQPHTKQQLAEWQRSLPLGGERVKQHRLFQGRSLTRLRNEGFVYVVMSSESWEPVAAHPTRYPFLARNYADIFARGEVIATFKNPWFDSDFFAPHHLLNSATVNVYHGPTLMVLKVPQDRPEGH